MTTILTFVLVPFMLIFGLPCRVTTVSEFVTPRLRKKFPWSSKTPIIVLEPHPWLLKYMQKTGIAAYAFLGFVTFAMDRRTTEIHEAIHVLHQSAISPIFYAIVYVFDWLAFLPFSKSENKWYPQNYWRRAPVAEHIAYTVSHIEYQLELDEARKKDPTFKK